MDIALPAWADLIAQANEGLWQDEFGYVHSSSLGTTLFTGDYRARVIAEPMDREKCIVHVHFDEEPYFPPPEERAFPTYFAHRERALFYVSRHDTLNDHGYDGHYFEMFNPYDEDMPEAVVFFRETDGTTGLFSFSMKDHARGKDTLTAWAVDKALETGEYIALTEHDAERYAEPEWVFPMGTGLVDFSEREPLPFPEWRFADLINDGVSKHNLYAAVKYVRNHSIGDITDIEFKSHDEGLEVSWEKGGTKHSRIFAEEYKDPYRFELQNNRHHASLVLCTRDNVSDPKFDLGLPVVFPYDFKE